jgi:hypothetical protein
MIENITWGKRCIKEMLANQLTPGLFLWDCFFSGVESCRLKVPDSEDATPVEPSNGTIDYRMPNWEKCTLEKSYEKLSTTKRYFQDKKKRQPEFQVSIQDIDIFIKALEQFKGIVVFFEQRKSIEGFFLKKVGKRFEVFTAEEMQKEINKGSDQTAVLNQLSPDVDTDHLCKESGDNEKMAHLTPEHFCWGQKIVVPDNSPIACYAFLNTISQYPIEETFRKDYLYELLKKEATNTSLDLLEKLILEKLKKEWQKG